MAKALILALGLLAAAAQAGSEPAAPNAAIPPPDDVDYRGVITLSVDASDVNRHIFRIHESLPVAAPGPLTFNLFAHGFTWGNGAWLAAVLIGTAIAGWFEQLPGVESRPYILRFDEDKPNPPISPRWAIPKPKASANPR